MAKPIMINGVDYPVVENLGWVHGRGCYARYVKTDTGERVAISHSQRGPWQFAKTIVSIGSRPCGQEPKGAGDEQGG